jgi:hypothetical protein
MTKVNQSFVLSMPGFAITCTKLSLSKMEIIAKSDGKAKAWIFAGCSTTDGEPICKLAGIEIETKPLVFEAEDLGTKEAKIVVKPETGKALADIEIAGSLCALSGEEPIKGQITVSLPTGQEEKTEQEIVANTPSGEVDIGAGSATLTGKAGLELESGDAWSYH